MVAEKIYDLLPDSLPKVVGELPSAETDVVAIMEYDGITSTEYFGPRGEGTSVLQPIVKILIRNSSYQTGSEWADLIKTTLHRYHDDYFINIMLVNVPIYLGRNEMKIHEFQVTFNTQVKE